MFIALVSVTLRLPSRDLKARRAIVRSVVERLRNRFNATVAEVPGDEPSVATIAAASLSSEAAHADSQAQAILRAVQEWRLDAEVVGVETEIIPC